jgi:hypothetical protein
MEQEIKEAEIVQIQEYDLAEWVCQFDNEEPVVIAWSNDETTPGELSFTLKANSKSSVVFQSADGRKRFSLFARSMSQQRRVELGLAPDTEETPN